MGLKASVIGMHTLAYGSVIMKDTLFARFLLVQCWNKIDVPKSVPQVEQTPIFEWLMIGCGSKSNTK
jgi:hypothetical protein